MTEKDAGDVASMGEKIYSTDLVGVLTDFGKVTNMMTGALMRLETMRRKGMVSPEYVDDICHQIMVFIMPGMDNVNATWNLVHDATRCKGKEPAKGEGSAK